MNERTADLRDSGVTDQVLVCTNDRAEHAACADAGGAAAFEAAVDWLRERDVLYSRVYVARTGCLGLCSTDGAAVVIQPRNRWFSEVNPGEVPALLSSAFGPEATRLGVGPDEGPDCGDRPVPSGGDGGSVPR